MLKIAIQKSGRLSEGSLKLLQNCGLRIDNPKRQLIAEAGNFPAQILYLRDDDIPQYVEDGVADVGIIGENVLLESGKEVKPVRKLGFSKCRVSLAVPRNSDYTGPSYFQGKKIATTYVNILRQYLLEQGVEAEIHRISGSVEIAPNIGLADGIMDIVSTGSTLLSNGLKEVETVLRAQAVLVSKNQLASDKQELLDKLVFRIDAVLRAKGYQYILLNAPNANLERIIEILPGMKSPTVLPLAEAGWSSVHTVIKESEFWDVIDALKEQGAQGIIIVPVEKMVI
ncbi:MAG: ATP phosphoribosyltransferase [Saprospiraceae bacterium]|nr:ATP phosphoribosyltransferase [Saprospiraceae bacterium]